jgi:outer membrane protein assembly factor BamB
MFSLSGRRIAASVLASFVLSTAGLCEDWPKYRHDLNNSGLSGESGISSSNVSQLALKWEFNVGGIVSASPAVATINGTSMVFVGGWNGLFYGVNAVTGQKIWSFQVDLVSPCSSGNCRIGSSAAVSNNIVYFGAENAYLYAVNAATGALVWKVQLANPNNGYEIWSSPAVNAGDVYVGLASHGDDPCVVGQVLARNASNGNGVWSFTTIDQSSCSNGQCVGASVWSSPAIDRFGDVYVGTGNPGSTCSPSTPNATRYPDSMLYLNGSDGQLISWFQAIANDNSDLDFGSSPFLYYTINDNQCSNINQDQFFVAEASKNGKLYICTAGLAGCSGTVLDGSEIIASPAVQTLTYTRQCQTQPPKYYSYSIPYQLTPTTGGNLYEGTSLIDHNGSTLYSAPAIIQDVVFFGSTDHKLHAARWGTSWGELWSYTTGGNVDSGPAISNGRIYFGSDDGYLRCLSIGGQ